MTQPSTKQFFKIKPPKELLYDLLNLSQCLLYRDKVYIFEVNSYKRLVYFDQVTPFLESLRPYFFKGKYHYLDRKYDYSTFAKFICLLRRIAREWDISYYRRIRYYHSLCQTDYYFPKVLALVLS